MGFWEKLKKNFISPIWKLVCGVIFPIWRFIYAILSPFKDNFAATMLLIGSILVLIMSIRPDIAENILLGSSKALLSIGSAIIGAGVFSAIMKSTQFTTIFQQNIFDVINNPERVHGTDTLVERWNVLTRAILTTVLPNTHDKAANEIMAQFFNEELSYHYESYRISYDISIIDDEIIVCNTTEARIIKTQGRSPCVFRQKVTAITDDCLSLELLSLDIDEKERKEQYVKDGKEATITVDLEKIEKCSISYKRVIRFKLKLSKEPYVTTDISRYIINGASIKVKITEGYNIHFQHFGGFSLPENYHKPKDWEGYEHWRLSSDDGLLLPGHGYILVFTKDEGTKDA